VGYKIGFSAPLVGIFLPEALEAAGCKQLLSEDRRWLSHTSHNEQPGIIFLHLPDPYAALGPFQQLPPSGPLHIGRASVSVVAGPSTGTSPVFMHTFIGLPQ